MIGFFKKLDSVFLEQAWFKTIQTLIRGKSFDFEKHGNRWMLAIDGTGGGASARPYDARSLKRVRADGVNHLSSIGSGGVSCFRGRICDSDRRRIYRKHGGQRLEAGLRN